MRRQRDENREREDHDPELGTPDVQAVERDGRRDVRAELAHVGSREELNDVAEHEREPEGHEHSCITPAPLRRIGRHITNSMASASSAVVTNANGSAKPSGKPSAERETSAMYAPNVKSSPCAKFTSFSTP